MWVLDMVFWNLLRQTFAQLMNLQNDDSFFRWTKYCEEKCHQSKSNVFIKSSNRNSEQNRTDKSEQNKADKRRDNQKFLS
jgi:hypothetical protein